MANRIKLENIKWNFFDIGSTLIDETLVMEYRSKEIIKEPDAEQVNLCATRFAGFCPIRRFVMWRKRMKREKVSYENRYKHKLNMLWPGQFMIKIVGVLLVIGMIFWLFKWQIIASAALILAGMIFTVLLILVAVELHQDKVLNEIAMRENKEREGKW